jgi:hypothetical protein
MARESRGLNAENTRAVSGLLAVVIGDTTIALAAILGIAHFPPTGAQGAENLALFAAILSSAFTAIGTMTTAYFGIKSISNTAQALSAAAAPAATPPGSATPQVPDTGQGSGTSPAQ